MVFKIRKVGTQYGNMHGVKMKKKTKMHCELVLKVEHFQLFNNTTCGNLLYGYKVRLTVIENALSN